MKRMRDSRLFSAGDCPICFSMGAVLFVKSIPIGSIFFFCPHCGCAWDKPPGRFINEIDHPDKYSPGGFTLPSEDEIKSAGLHDLISDRPVFTEWDSSLEEYLKS